MTRVIRLIAGAAGALFLLAALTVAWFDHAVFSDRSFPAAPVDITIARGASVADVAEELASHDVIGSALFFRVLVRGVHAEGDVRAGAYHFKPHETTSEILNALRTGGAQVATWVTIPEGFTAAQISQRFADAGIGQAGDTERAFKAAHLEGYLFPSTYLVPLDAGPQAIAKELTDEFAREIPADAKARAAGLGISVAQGVTVASLIEREAKADSDRPLIAGVIYNRLRLRMPLQIDASIEYALPEHKTELSFADLKIDSPYNTYIHDGLPPTPIANPGRPSLEAAFHPARTEALYYVYCGNGHHVFAKTLAEHQANVARCLH